MLPGEELSQMPFERVDALAHPHQGLQIGTAFRFAHDRSIGNKRAGMSRESSRRPGG